MKYKLRDLIEINNKSVKPQNNTTYYHYSIPAFDDNMNPEISDGSEIKSSKFIVPNDCILFSKLNVRFKRVWKVKLESNDNCICSTEFLPLVLKNNILTKDYLYNFLTSDYVIETLAKASSGTSNSHQRITSDILLNLDIAVPSIEEQIKSNNMIVPMVDKINNNNILIEHLKQLEKSLFIRTFINYEFNNNKVPNSWKLVSIGDVIKPITERVNDDNLEVYTVINSGDLIKQSEYFKKNVHSKDIKKYKKINKYDFAYNPARINIGSIGMFRATKPGAVSPIYIAFNTEDKYWWFFDQLIKFPYIQEEIKKRCSGSVRQSLNYDDFCKIKIHYPDIKTIEKYNSIIDNVNELLELLKIQNASIGSITKIMLDKEFNMEEI